VQAVVAVLVDSCGMTMVQGKKLLEVMASQPGNTGTIAR